MVKQVSIRADHKLALDLVREGKPDQAIEKLYEAMTAHPADYRIPADLLRVLVLEQRFEEAEELVRNLTQEMQSDNQLSMLCTQVEIITASHPRESDTPKLLVNYYRSLEENPDQLEKRLKLASILVKIDDLESALEQLYAIRQADRTFRDDIGHRGMLALFGMLGEENDLVTRYRGKIT
jgi:thioredoxin-like negative regulator of GroEL